MATDRHVHLTARTPLTTISLGTPGGDAPAGRPSGVCIYSAEQKYEEIKGNVSEQYWSDKVESVTGATKETFAGPKVEQLLNNWTQTCEMSKEENVIGAVTQNFSGTVTHNFDTEHNLNVGKPSIYKYGATKTESITGDYIVNVSGIHVSNVGEEVVHKKTSRHVTSGIKFDSFLGVNGAANLSAKFEHNTGIKLETNQGVKAEATGMSVKAVGVKWEKTGVDLTKKTSAVANTNVTINMAVLVMIMK